MDDSHYSYITKLKKKKKKNPVSGWAVLEILEASGLEDPYFKKAPVLGPSGIVMLGKPMLKGIAQRKIQLDFYQIFTFFCIDAQPAPMYHSNFPFKKVMHAF
jgi:hypothetical protein